MILNIWSQNDEDYFYYLLIKKLIKIKYIYFIFRFMKKFFFIFENI